MSSTPEIVPLPSTGRPESYGPDPNGLDVQAVATAIAERGERDAAGRFDMSGLILKQGDLTYVVNQRVVTSQATKLRLTRGIRWQPLRKGESPHLHRGFAKRGREEYEAEEKTSVVDLDVLGPDDELVATISFDGSKINSIERDKKQAFLDQWPDGTGEFLLFVASHGPQAERKHYESWAAKSGFPLPGYLTPEAGNMTLPRDSLDSVEWGAKPATPPAELPPAEIHNFRMPLTGSKNLLKQAFLFREQESGLSDIPGSSLRGVTITRDGHRIQITQDDLLHTPAAPKPIITRTYRISEYNAEGHELRRDKRIYNSTELNKLLGDELNALFDEIKGDLDRATGQNGGEYDPDILLGLANSRQFISFQVAQEDLRNAQSAWQRRAARIGQVATQRTPAQAPGDRMSTQEAFEVLSSPELLDLNSPDATVREEAEQKLKEKVAELKERSGVTEAVHGLRAAIQNFGADVVNALAEEIRKDYLEAATLLRLPTQDERASLSWVLWDIGEQYYYSQHPDEAQRQLDRFGGYGPLGDSREVRFKDDEMVDYATGLKFINEAIVADAVTRPAFELNERGALENNPKGKPQFVVDERHIEYLEEYYKPEILTILGKILDAKNAELGSWSDDDQRALLKRIIGDETDDEADRKLEVNYRPSRVAVADIGRWLLRERQR